MNFYFPSSKGIYWFQLQWPFFSSYKREGKQSEPHIIKRYLISMWVSLLVRSSEYALGDLCKRSRRLFIGVQELNHVLLKFKSTPSYQFLHARSNNECEWDFHIMHYPSFHFYRVLSLKIKLRYGVLQSCLTSLIE